MLDPGHLHGDSQTDTAGVNELAADQDGPDTPLDHVGGNNLRAAQNPYGTQPDVGGANQLAEAHTTDGTQRGRGFGKDFPTATDNSSPTGVTPSGTILPPTVLNAKPTPASSAATISDPGQWTFDTQSRRAGADLQADPGHRPGEAQKSVAGADLNDALLAVLADALDDLERVRIATENRARSLRQIKGLEGTKFEAHLTELTDTLAALEHKATLDLQRAMRQHPLGAFVKQTRGLGEKQAARLLAAIGDPATRPNPAKLWQYSGHGDPARSKLRRGQPVEFSPTAKMRVHLCAESMLRAGNRAIYDRERAKWADRDTTDGHKHAHALRVVGKQLLLDLWKAAREVQSS